MDIKSCEVMSISRTFDSKLSNLTLDLEDFGAHEFIVKEAEERACILQEQHESQKLSLEHHISNIKAFLEKD